MSSEKYKGTPIKSERKDITDSHELKCLECDKTFDNKKSLKRHMHIHIGDFF